MRKLILLSILVLVSIFTYSQTSTFGGIGLRVNDSTSYQSNASGAHSAGYYDIYFNNQATSKHWDVWNGSSYDHVFDFNGGGLTLSDVTGTQDLFVSASAMWPRTTNGCADLAKTEVSTSLFNIQTLDFDQSTDEFAQFQVVLPRKWNNGTVTVVVYWTAASGTGDVIWSINGGAYSNDDALSTAFGTAQSTTDTFLAANDVHISSATSAITLGGTPADADFLAFQISRDADNGSDTFSADAKLLGISIRITTDAAKDN